MIKFQQDLNRVRRLEWSTKLLILSDLNLCDSDIVEYDIPFLSSDFVIIEGCPSVTELWNNTPSQWGSDYTMYSLKSKKEIGFLHINHFNEIPTLLSISKDHLFLIKRSNEKSYLLEFYEIRPEVDKKNGNYVFYKKWKTEIGEYFDNKFYYQFENSFIINASLNNELRGLLRFSYENGEFLWGYNEDFTEIYEAYPLNDQKVLIIGTDTVMVIDFSINVVLWRHNHNFNSIECHKFNGNNLILRYFDNSVFVFDLDSFELIKHTFIPEEEE